MPDNYITPSKREIYSKLLDIAGKYTDIENTDYLKTGLFGYITEAMAMMIRDSSIHKSMVYRESFLNTAVMPKSVYNWAKMFNINISKATPAYADIDIVISRDDLDQMVNLKKIEDYGDPTIKVPSELSEKTLLLINKKDPILAGNYYFMLEHSIIIWDNSKDSDGYTSYSAQYLNNDYEPVTTSYQDITNPIIPIRVEGGNYKFKARAYQYQIQEFKKQIPDNSLLNTKIHTFEFENQFADIAVSYVRPGYIEQPIVPRYNSLQATGTGDYCYYSLNNPNEVQISFSSVDGSFMPRGNDQLIVRVITTLGASIPSMYTGDAIFLQSNDDLKKFPILVQFNPTNIIGGADVPSLTSIKNTIINEISSRDVIITESDINNYFTIITSLLETINSGRAKFIKQRDDILKRMFSVYILLRDGLDDSIEETIDGDNTASSSFISRCIPTNTITATFPIATNVQKKFGSSIILRSDSDEYVYTPEYDVSDDVYIIPFYMYICLNPIRKVKYIYNLTDDTTPIFYKKVSISNNASYVTPTTVRIVRETEGSAAQPFYTIIFNFESNFSFSDISTLNSNSAAGYRLSFKNANNKTNIIDTDYFDFNIIDDHVLYESTETKTNTGETVYNSSIAFTIDVANNEFNFNIEELYKVSSFGNTINLKNISGNTVAVSDKVSLSLEFISDINLPNGTKLNRGTVIQNQDALTMFQNLDDIMFSDLTINTDDENIVTSLTIHDIPVIHQSYFTSRDRQDKFVSQLFTYIGILKENINKLETNTFFDLKFYNTYGRGAVYNTLKTNIDLKFEITLKEAYKNDDSLKTEIRSYIRRLVDESNKAECLRLSSIIATINNSESYADYIDHIDFVGLNDTFNQYIGKVAGIDESYYVPEWLNIQPDDLINNIKFVD